jgi:hypothetical protein
MPSYASICLRRSRRLARCRVKCAPRRRFASTTSSSPSPCKPCRRGTLRCLRKAAQRPDLGRFSAESRKYKGHCGSRSGIKRRSSPSPQPCRRCHSRRLSDSRWVGHGDAHILAACRCLALCPAGEVNPARMLEPGYEGCVTVMMQVFGTGLAWGNCLCAVVPLAVVSVLHAQQRDVSSPLRCLCWPAQC